MLPDGSPKPPCTSCPFQSQLGGCRVYGNRPEDCRTYRCMWLDGLGRLSDRPDKIGALFEEHFETPMPVVVVRTTGPGRLHNPRVKALLKGIRDKKTATAVVHPEQARKAYEEHGWMVIAEVHVPDEEK